MILSHLLARTVYAHYTESPTVYLTGYDSNRDVSVCIAVVNKTTPADAAREYELAWSWTYDYNFMVDQRETWLVGLAYVECSGEFEPLEFPDEELDPLRITPDEYQRIVAEAQS